MRKPFFLFFVIFLSFLPVFVVQANVPSVLSVTRRTESDNLIMDVRVSHSEPSGTHYISVITLDLDGVTKSFTDLPKATQVEAIYSINLGSASPKVIKAQATCNTHGPGAYLTEGSTGSPSSGGIPGYPIEAVLIGVLAALCLVYVSKSAR